MTLDELKLRHSVLLAARYSGTRSVSYDGKTVTYGTDAELAAAISDIERRIAKAERGAGRILRPSCREGSVMNWRQRLGAFIGGFDAGQHHRRLRGFRATRAHVNALIAASGPDITARARWLVRNNGYAVNAVESWGREYGRRWGSNQSRRFAMLPAKKSCSGSGLPGPTRPMPKGLTDFYGLQRRAAREVFIAGEVFFRIRMRRAGDGLTVPLQLQMLPAEMLPLEQTGAAANGNAIRQGIEFDRIGAARCLSLSAAASRRQHRSRGCLVNWCACPHRK